MGLHLPWHRARHLEIQKAPKWPSDLSHDLSLLLEAGVGGGGGGHAIHT